MRKIIFTEKGKKSFKNFLVEKLGACGALYFEPLTAEAEETFAEQDNNFHKATTPRLHFYTLKIKINDMPHNSCNTFYPEVGDLIYAD
jgi:hypothetical protein